MSEKNWNVDIICPLFNGREYVEKLHASFLMQKNVSLNIVRYVVTNTGDEVEGILSKLERAVFRVINLEAFSHSKVREEEALRSTADIIVFVTQDIIIERDDWLEKLIDPIISGECDASYGRQICTDPIIEKYIREKNYPEKSFVKTLDSIPQLGMKTFFFSNVSSAVSRNLFVQLGGYDGKVLSSNEDTYFAYKLITGGYRIKYCADSEVVHFHKYTIPELYRRYYLSGKIFKVVPQLNKYKASESGKELAAYVWKRALEDNNYRVLLRFLPDMMARYIGMKAGQLS